jgi:hydroxymethylpyrimidine pyrophosphatase-like HAD family hydrolase
MIYDAAALDYDGTLATDGIVPPHVVDGLSVRARAGIKLVLVSGRERDDLEKVFDAFELFEQMVLENGALLFHPRSAQEEVIAKPPPAALLRALHERGVSPLSCGRVVVATSRAHEASVRAAIEALELELATIFNKGSLMVLPRSVNKASGLLAALRRMRIGRQQVVGIGDAENDVPMLAACALGVAVANAVDSLKRDAAFVTNAARGDGVLEAMSRFFPVGMGLAAQ